MTKTLTGIYYNTIDRLHLNEKSTKYEDVKMQYERDLQLKELLSEVMEAPEDYDIYYKKDTLELIIEPLEDEQNHMFNRIDIDKFR